MISSFREFKRKILYKILEFEKNYEQMKKYGEVNANKIKIFEHKYFATALLKILCTN